MLNSPSWRSRRTFQKREDEPICARERSFRKNKRGRRDQAYGGYEKTRQRRTKQGPHSRRISPHDYPQPPKGLTDRMYDAIEDPYTYKNSTVLVNKLDLQSQDKLRRSRPKFRVRVRGSRYRTDCWILFTTGLSIIIYFKTSISGRAGFARSEFRRAAIRFAFPRISRDRQTSCSPICNRQTIFEISMRRHLQTRQRIFLAELNAIHAFREGNGRSQLTFFALLADHAGHSSQDRETKS